MSCRLRGKCHNRKALNLNLQGHLKDGRWTSSSKFIVFMAQIRKDYESSIDVMSDFQLPIHRFQRFLDRNGIRSWPLESSTNRAISVGRKAELFILSQPDFKVVRDSWKCRSAKEPFDFILQVYGAVDAKSTYLQNKKLRGYADPVLFWAFNIGKLNPATKFTFLVGYDESRTHVLALFIIPKKDLRGAKSVTIMANPIRGYYSKYLYKEYESGRITIKSSICT